MTTYKGKELNGATVREMFLSYCKSDCFEFMTHKGKAKMSEPLAKTENGFEIRKGRLEGFVLVTGIYAGRIAIVSTPEEQLFNYEEPPSRYISDEEYDYMEKRKAFGYMYQDEEGW